MKVVYWIIIILFLITLLIKKYKLQSIDYTKILNDTEIEELRYVFSGITKDYQNNPAKNELINLLVKRNIWKYYYQRPSKYIPELLGEPIWDTKKFDFVKKLENNFNIIEDEVNQIETDLNKLKLISNVNEDIYQGKWKDLFFYNNGARNDVTCKAFPGIANIIDSIPEFQGVNPGCVCLSFIYPGTKVEPHFGISNNKLRLHLGIKNLDNSTLYVRDKSNDNKAKVLSLNWEKGKAFIFDDSFEHWVINNNVGLKPRIILLADIWHPQLSKKQISLMSNNQSVFFKKYPFLSDLVIKNHITTISKSDEYNVRVIIDKNLQIEIAKYFKKIGIKHFSYNKENNSFRVTLENETQKIMN